MLQTVAGGGLKRQVFRGRRGFEERQAVAGGYGALFVLVTPAGAVLIAQIVLIVSEDGETAFAAICFAVG